MGEGDSHLNAGCALHPDITLDNVLTRTVAVFSTSATTVEPSTTLASTASSRRVLREEMSMVVAFGDLAGKRGSFATETRAARGPDRACGVLPLSEAK